MVKAFSPRWQAEKPGAPITIPPETTPTVESILHGRNCLTKYSAGSAMDPRPRDGPSALTLTDTKGKSDSAVRFHDGRAVQVRRVQPGSLPYFYDGA